MIARGEIVEDEWEEETVVEPENQKGETEESKEEEKRE
jgi:hypothetical protein